MIVVESRRLLAALLVCLCGFFSCGAGAQPISEPQDQWWAYSTYAVKCNGAVTVYTGSSPLALGPAIVANANACGYQDNNYVCDPITWGPASAGTQCTHSGLLGSWTGPVQLQCSSGKLFDPNSQKCLPICQAGASTIPGVSCIAASNNGAPCLKCQGLGDPVNSGPGIKYQRETYLDEPTPAGLTLGIWYNAGIQNDGYGALVSRFGQNWVDQYATNIKLYAAVSSGAGVVATSVGVQRPDGKEFEFDAPAAGNLWIAKADVNDTLARQADAAGNLTGWIYTAAAGDSVEIYDAQGRLLSITNRQGLTQSLAYADGAGGILYSAGSPLGYTAPACNPPAGWSFETNASGPLTPQTGRLLCVTDPFGRQFNFHYDNPLGSVVQAADPAGGIYQFQYGGPSAVQWVAGNPLNLLTQVTLPDGSTRVYAYNEQANINGGNACANLPAAGMPNQLTGITDEDGNRYATWTYDCQGRATSSVNAGGVGQVRLAYDTPATGQTTVTETLGTAQSPVATSRVYGFSTILGVIKNSAITDPATGQAAPCASCGGVGSRGYDANGNVQSEVDWNGNQSCIGYDLTRNLPTRSVEGLAAGANCSAYLSGTPALSGAQRMTSTVWSGDWHLPLQVAEPLRITTYTYGGPGDANPGNRGNVLTRSVQPTADASGAAGFGATAAGSPRVWTYTYNADGLVLSVDGPRTDVADVTTFTYYADTDPDPGKRGNIAAVSNALNQATLITAYNTHGQPLTVVDPNGLATALSYDSRLRLTSRSVGGMTTSYSYDAAGLLIQVVLPDASSVTYSYDAAHRLTAVADNLGNTIAYTLDLQDNRVAENVYDPSNQLAQTRSRVYDALNRLQQDIGAQSQTTQYAYDAQGNLTSVTDPLKRVTSNSYDALNRLAAMTQPVPSAGSAAPVVGYAYDGLNRLTQVTDPRGLVTSYAYDGLGNLNAQVSPDTGSTGNTYDAAGNILTSTDAKGQVTTYTYDALNRLATVSYNQAAGSQLKTVAYAYDQGANGIGRLTTVTETAADGATALQTTQYAYDPLGHLASETRTLAGNASPYATSYTYDASSGRLLGMSYPSGRTLSYSYDGAGRISQIGTTAPAAQGGQSQLLVFGVTYQPFGGVKSYVLGNNHVITRGYDQDGRIASYTLGGSSVSVGYDAASRITSLLDASNAANSTSYGYDGLDRLTSASVPATNYSYSYDLTGNRVSRNAGSATTTTSIGPASNQITQVAGSTTRPYSYDANGSTAADGNNQYAYDARGRLVQSVGGAGSTTYQVGANGQRVRKTSQLGDTVFHYDAQGKLIMETAPDGTVRKEYLYLLDIPVAVSAPQQ